MRHGCSDTPHSFLDTFKSHRHPWYVAFETKRLKWNPWHDMDTSSAPRYNTLGIEVLQNRRYDTPGMTLFQKRAKCICCVTCFLRRSPQEGSNSFYRDFASKNGLRHLETKHSSASLWLHERCLQLPR